MEDFYFDNKKYIRSKEAAKLAGYSQDHISRLARNGDVDARRVGRSWYIEEEGVMKLKNEHGQSHSVHSETVDTSVEIEPETVPEVEEKVLSGKSVSPMNPMIARGAAAALIVTVLFFSSHFVAFASQFDSTSDLASELSEKVSEIYESSSASVGNALSSVQTSGANILNSTSDSLAGIFRSATRSVYCSVVGIFNSDVCVEFANDSELVAEEEDVTVTTTINPDGTTTNQFVDNSVTNRSTTVVNETISNSEFEERFLELVDRHDLSSGDTVVNNSYVTSTNLSKQADATIDSITSAVSGGTTGFSGASLTVTGDMSADTGDVSALTLTILDDGTIAGDFTVSGTTTLSGITVLTGTTTLGSVIEGSTTYNSGTLTFATGTTLGVNGDAVFDVITVGTTTATSTISGGLIVDTDTLVVDFANSRVGIGDTTPSYKLDVAGVGRFTSFVDADHFVATNTNATSTFAGDVDIDGKLLVATSTRDYQFAVTGTSYLDGAVTFGSSASFANGLAISGGTITFADESVGSNIIPSLDGTYDLGSASRQWSTIYANTITAGSIAGTISGGETDSPDWKINADATTTAESSTLSFETGTGIDDATIGWDKDDNRIEFNYPIYINNSSTSVFAGNIEIASTTATSTISGGLVVDTNSLVVDHSSGNVGVGDTTPSYKLDVAGTGRYTGLLTLDSGLTVSGANLTLSGSSANIALGSNYISGDGDDEGIVVSSAGFVGIGTSTPYAMLSVAGEVVSTKFTASDSAATSTLEGNLYVGGDINFVGNLMQGGAEFVSSLWTDSGSNELYITGMNVGIGTTTPYAALSVVGETVSEYFSATSTTATSTFAGGFNVDSGSILHDFSSGVTSIDTLELSNFVFDTDAGVVQWIDLPVSASAASSTAESFIAQIDGESMITVYAQSDGAGGIADYSKGVGIGTSSPAYMLDVQSSVTGDMARFTDGSGAYCTLDPASGLACTSDQRFKYDVEDLSSFATSTLDKITTLRPVKYHWITDDVTDELKTGLIAQEVEEIYPELVRTGKDGTKLVNYGGFMPYIIESIKEIAVKLDSLQTQITALVSGGVSSSSDSSSDGSDGVTLNDRVTGDVYCLVIEDGDIEKLEGACADLDDESDENNDSGSGGGGDDSGDDTSTTTDDGTSTTTDDGTDDSNDDTSTTTDDGTDDEEEEDNDTSTTTDDVTGDDTDEGDDSDEIIEEEEEEEEVVEEEEVEEMVEEETEEESSEEEVTEE